MDNISDKLLLLKKDLKVDDAMSTNPIIIVGQGIRVPCGVDEGRHAACAEIGSG